MIKESPNSQMQDFEAMAVHTQMIDLLAHRSHSMFVKPCQATAANGESELSQGMEAPPQKVVTITTNVLKKTKASNVSVHLSSY